MSLNNSATIQAVLFEGSIKRNVDMTVSAEYHVKLLINGRPFLSVACSGNDLEILAVGHMVSEGLILSREEITSVEVSEERLEVNVVTAAGTDIIGRLFRIRTLVSGCAGGESGTDLPRTRGHAPVSARVLCDCMKEFLGLSQLHQLTHGVHSAALYDTGGSRIAFFDEIGRHNAVDKLIGRLLLEGISPSGYMLLSTGRISSEIVAKAATAGIPAIVTRAAPTSMAVRLARDTGMFLVTRVFKDRFYVINGEQYVLE